jgi:hypothetical protein
MITWTHWVLKVSVLMEMLNMSGRCVSVIYTYAMFSKETLRANHLFAH